MEKWKHGDDLNSKKTKRAGQRYAPEGAEVHSPAASEATPWGIAKDKQSTRKGKSIEIERVMFTVALAGRGVIGCGGLPRVSLRLPWAMEVIGLSARLGLTF